MEPEGMGLDPTGITQIIVHFNEPMVQAGLELTKLIGFGDPTLQFVSLSADKKIATFNINPASPIRGSAGYALQVDNSAKDLSGNPIAQGGAVYFFSTADNNPPLVYDISPLGNHVAPSLAEVSMYFSEGVDESTLGLINVFDPVANTMLTNLNRSYDPASRKLTIGFTTGSFREKQQYDIKIEAGLADTAGNTTASAQIFSFRTADISPPSVVSITPDNELNLIYFSGLLIKIKFNEEMDRFSLLNSPMPLTNITTGIVTLLPLTSYDPVIGEAVYAIPAEDLGSYQEFSFTTPTTLTDKAGISIQNSRTGYFTTTADQLIPTLPKVSRTNIVDCGVKGMRIRTEFNRKMDFPTSPATHTVQARFDYVLPRVSGPVTLPNVTSKNSNGGRCSPVRNVIHVPNPRFLFCVWEMRFNPYVFVCWLLPLTIPIDDTQPGPCFGYPADHSNSRQTTVNVNSLNYSTDQKVATFGNTAGFHPINRADNYCARPIHGWIDGSLQPTSFNSYSCNEYNTSTSLTIDTQPTSPSFIDLNGKEFRFSGQTSHGFYSGYPISPRSNECSN